MRPGFLKRLAFGPGRAPPEPRPIAARAASPCLVLLCFVLALFRVWSFGFESRCDPHENGRTEPDRAARVSCMRRRIRQEGIAPCHPNPPTVPKDVSWT